VHLLRFAFIALDGQTRDWGSFSLKSDSAVVSVFRSWPGNGRLVLLVCAEVPLQALPGVGEDGLVDVPDAERRAAEAAIESAANVLSVGTGHGRPISSPNLAVAFRAETDAEEKFLNAQAGVRGADKGVAYGRLSIHVEQAILAQLADRDEGLALLAEALAQEHPSGRYHELLRVFEQGFAESADRLVPPLYKFLALRPRLGYTKSEIKRWVVRLRGPATHADRHVPLLEADLRAVVDRMLLAAYETLFNKQTWNSKESDRRDLWTPTIGPLDPSGAWFVVQHRTEAPLQAQLYDPYGAYPLNLGADGLRLNDGCWPRSGHLQMTSREQAISIVPASELAIVESKR
jgi:hypothetical protein